MMSGFAEDHRISPPSKIKAEHISKNISPQFHDLTGMGHNDVANSWSGRWPTWKASAERDGNQVKRGKGAR
jgi:hypothetical protein